MHRLRRLRRHLPQRSHHRSLSEIRVKNARDCKVMGVFILEPEVVRSVADFVQMLDGEFADAAFGDVGE